MRDIRIKAALGAPLRPATVASLSAARAALSERRWAELQQLCSEILQREPANAEAYHLLGRGAIGTGAMSQAVPLLQRATELAPERPDFLASFGQALLACNRAAEAKAVAERALALPGGGPDTLDTLGVILSRTGAEGLARDAFRSAVALAPRSGEIWHNLAWAEQYTGELGAAAEAFRRAIRLDPGNARAMLGLVELERQTAERNLIPQLEQLFAGPGGGPDRQLLLGHAMAKTYEDLGQPHEAFDWLVKGKAGKRAAVGYDHAQTEAMFHAAAAAAATGGTRVPTALSDEAPIFVLGLPRSGTTLVDRILSSHPDVASAGEPTTFPVLVRRRVGAPPQPWLSADIFRRARLLDPARLGAEYMEATRPLAPGAPRLLDKTPIDFLFAGLINRALPNARLVCVRRDPLDSILSMFRQSFSENTQYDFSFGLEDTARYYVLFDRLMAHWRATLPPDRFREVSYEAVVEDLEGQARSLLDFAGLAWDPAVLDFHHNAAPVTSASAAQVRSPLYSSSVGRWRKYGDRMDPAKAVLAEAGLL